LNNAGAKINETLLKSTNQVYTFPPTSKVGFITTMMTIQQTSIRGCRGMKTPCVSRLEAGRKGGEAVLLDKISKNV